MQGHLAHRRFLHRLAEALPGLVFVPHLSDLAEDLVAHLRHLGLVSGAGGREDCVPADHLGLRVVDAALKEPHPELADEQAGPTPLDIPADHLSRLLAGSPSPRLPLTQAIFMFVTALRYTLPYLASRTAVKTNNAVVFSITGHQVNRFIPPFEVSSQSQKVEGASARVTTNVVFRLSQYPGASKRTLCSASRPDAMSFNT